MSEYVRVLVTVEAYGRVPKDEEFLKELPNLIRERLINTTLPSMTVRAWVDDVQTSEFGYGSRELCPKEWKLKEKTLYNQGFGAYFEDVLITDCPYEFGNEKIQWLRGWVDAEVHDWSDI